jgi:hypothetical protein
MTVPEKVKASGLCYDTLLNAYKDVLEQTGSKEEAGDHIFWLSEGWEGDEFFTLPELVGSLEKES